MNRWLQFALVAVLTFAVTITLTSRPAAEPAPAAVPGAAPARVAIEAETPIAVVQHRELATASHTIGRNLFAYVAPPPPPVSPERRVVATRVIVEAPARPAETLRREREKPRFDYRFIGRFGSDENPIAAFARDGEIVTARRGDRVGVFRVREVGLESVDVASDAGVVRVALDR